MAEIREFVGFRTDPKTRKSDKPVWLGLPPEQWATGPNKSSGPGVVMTDEEIDWYINGKRYVL